MKKWQAIVKEHHNISVVDDAKVIVKDVIYDTINKTYSDDTVTRIEEGYQDSEGNKYESIYEYLGY